MTVLFISDLHLSEQHPQLSALLEKFADQHLDSQCQALYILGDLFDAWIGDDFDSPGIQQTVAILQKMAACCPVYFIHGNRDFLVGEAFAQRANITLLPEHHVLTLDNERVLVMHGDTLCTDDQEYMTYRAMVRQPAWQQAVMTMSIEERLAKAKALRESSQEAASNKSDDIMDVNPTTVEETMLAHHCHKLIHGHTHRPNIHSFELGGKPANRIVLSDWQPTRGNYLRYENGQAELHYFDL